MGATQVILFLAIVALIGVPDFIKPVLSAKPAVLGQPQKNVPPGQLKQANANVPKVKHCPVQAVGCQYGSAAGLAHASKRLTKFTPKAFQQNLDENCQIFEKYRTPDGTCNNARNLGAAHKPHRRLLPGRYDDGIDSARFHGKDGLLLPLPTEVSRLIHVDLSNLSGMTLLFMQWGQFVDHDLSLTPVATDKFTKKTCCALHGHPRTSCLAMHMGAGDTRFTGGCMEFSRSLSIDHRIHGPRAQPREQMNAITSFIDASNVYGSSIEEQHELRNGHLLKTSAGNLLPAADPDAGGCKLNAPGHFCFLAGDDRVNEQPFLATMHTVYMRLHNSIANALATHPAYGGNQEEIFQVARKIVGAIMQNLHYNEWLPLVVGDAVMQRYNLKTGQRVSLVPSVDPRVTNDFATAAFRFGHSLIPKAFNVSGTLHRLRELFNHPDLLFTDFNGMVETLVSPSPFSRAQTIDLNLVDEITAHLFEPANDPGHGFDLAALNIQRGREHGLPPFNEYRKLCGLSPVTNFVAEFGAQVGAKLASLYRSPDDLDLFSGGLLESQGTVGPVFACIIGLQFRDLKFGDRFYFETDRQVDGFNDAQLAALRGITKAHVLCQSGALTSVQRHAFQLPSATNPTVSCAQLNQQFNYLMSLF